MTKPPFIGSKIVSDISVDEVERLLDKEALFAARWQLRQGASAEAWEGIRRDKAEPVFARLMAASRAGGTITPKMAYGYFKCRKQGNGLVVDGSGRSFRFDFPRERQEPHRCLADFFESGFVPIQVATVGSGAAKAAADAFARGLYADAFYIKGLAAAMAEAATAFAHAQILRELGAPADIGARFSPGYPAFPDLMDQRKIFALLAPARIGVTLTETCQMVPEYSTSAVVSIDPRAIQFRP